jgi:hypothetical protein
MYSSSGIACNASLIPLIIALLRAADINLTSGGLVILFAVGFPASENSGETGPVGLI